ncbi:unnamed protein product, partial [Cladocopium goreaui]
EMPVPTELPSPTSPAEDEANTITEHQPTRTVSQPVQSFPTVASGQALEPPPASGRMSSALMSSGLVDSSAPIDSPSVAVPTELPTPTSPLGEATVEATVEATINVPTLMPLPSEQPSVPTRTREEPTAELPIFAARLTAATARAQVTERDPSDPLAAEPAKSPTEMPQMDAER